MSTPEFDPNAPALDGAGIFGLPHDVENAAVVLLPVPWDATTSYRPGTADGPDAIRAASLQVDLHDIDTGDPWRAGIAMLDEPDGLRDRNAEARIAAEQVIAAGGRVDGVPALQAELARVNEFCAGMNATVRAACEPWLDAGRLVGLVGGDHSTPFGLIEAVAARHPGVGILHFDAHADLRAAYEGFTWSHASIMFNVQERLPGVERIVQVGIRDLCKDEVDLIEASAGRIRPHYMSRLREAQFGGATWDALCGAIVDDLPETIFVSFDIDGLDPVLCPHTGTPVPNGLAFAEASHVLATAVRSGRRIVGFDLNEVAPGPDGDEWDGNVGARMLYRMIGWALKSRQ